MRKIQLTTQIVDNKVRASLLIVTNHGSSVEEEILGLRMYETEDEAKAWAQAVAKEREIDITEYREG